MLCSAWMARALVEIGLRVLLEQLADDVGAHMDGAADILLAALIDDEAEDAGDHQVVEQGEDIGKGDLRHQRGIAGNAVVVAGNLLRNDRTGRNPDDRQRALLIQGADHRAEAFALFQFFQRGAGIEDQVAVAFAFVHSFGDALNLLHQFRLRAGKLPGIGAGLLFLDRGFLAALGHRNLRRFFRSGILRICFRRDFFFFLLTLLIFIENSHGFVLHSLIFGPIPSGINSLPILSQNRKENK